MAVSLASLCVDLLKLNAFVRVHGTGTVALEILLLQFVTLYFSVLLFAAAGPVQTSMSN